MVQQGGSVPEVDNGGMEEVHSINGVATSVTAFLGRAVKGPVNTPIQVSSYSDFERIFGGLSSNLLMGYAVKNFFYNGGREAIIVRVHRNATAAKIAVDVRTSPPLTLHFEAINPGEWGNRLHVEVVPLGEGDLVDLLISEKDGHNSRVMEEYKRISINDINVALEQNSSVLRIPNPEETAPKLPDDNKGKASGGTNGDPITDDEMIPEGEGRMIGLYALENVDIFNLLCIPPYQASEGALATDQRPTDVSVKVIEHALNYCAKRRAMLIVDPHSSWDSAQKAIDGLAGYPAINSSQDHAAIFFPRLKQPDPLNNYDVNEFVPCGAVAGVICKTDYSRGVWKAPAGTDALLSGVDALKVNLSDADNGRLNHIGVNCLRKFPSRGIVIWGSRTMAGDDRMASEWKYLAVRRTALFIEESLYQGTLWSVFEPNDENLWAKIRLSVGAFMHNLFRQGAFQGNKRSEAYFVKCDAETNTISDINLRKVRYLVGFAAMRPAEFVVLEIRHTES